MNTKIKFLTQSPIYSYKDINTVIDISLNDSMLVSDGEFEVYECPCAFDIETTSFVDTRYEDLLREAEYQQELLEIELAKHEEIESIYKAIREEGGIYAPDVIKGWGKNLARDISRKWRGIYRKNGVSLDLLAERLVDRGFTQFASYGEAYSEYGGGDANLLLEWLNDNSREKPHIDTIAPINSTTYKRACMYVWQLGINGNVIIGREWSELLYVFDVITKKLKLSPDKRLRIYVHNLSFEFQFLRKYFNWTDVFAINPRYPVYALTKTGIEFRCSLILSGYSLANLGNELQKYPVQKMTGDLDYSLARHSKTPLTEAELKYCENDVRVVMSYIQERIEIDGGITSIPTTKTGYVRKYCRNCCLYSGSSNNSKDSKKRIQYRELMKRLTIDTDFEYKQLKASFQGGFTHARAFHSGEILEDVASYDFTSSYPYVMVAEMFPMSKGTLIALKNKDEFYHYIRCYCCIFDVEFIGLMSKFPYENYISESKCPILEGETVDNGRVVCAERLITTITEQDFAIIQALYDWDKISISNFRYYTRGYLPCDFVLAILKLYSDKTTLKGVAGREIDYQASKSMLNAAYGMCVTDICREKNIYTKGHKWQSENPDYTEAIEKYNNDPRRFLSYVWGVYVTAYARRNLFAGIFEYLDDYVYSDTDSDKVLNYRRHENYIKQYNERCRAKLERACKWHNIPFEMVEPSTIKGEKKLLGAWEFEGIYSRFKTLGAKRYMTEKNGTISLTVSGLNKTHAVPYLLDTYGTEGIFDAFTDGLEIPANATGKNTHTYIDFECSGELTDYMGITAPYHELSSMNIEPAEYDLSIFKGYIKFLMGVKEIEL